MENINAEQMTFTEVRHLPIVKETATAKGKAEPPSARQDRNISRLPGKVNRILRSRNRSSEGIDPVHPCQADFPQAWSRIARGWYISGPRAWPKL